jgi:hypothetical protein
MRLTAVVATVIAALSAAPAAGQSAASPFYAGGVTAVDFGDRGPVRGGVVPSAGGLIGVRFGGAWSLELEVDRAVREKTRTDEAIGFSLAPMNSTRAEIERLGVRMRWIRTESAGPGWSAHVMWRSREPGRVNAALFAGTSARRYTNRTQRTTLSVPAEANLPPESPLLQPSDTTRRMSGAGLTGGVLVLIQLTRAITLAPEVRYTFGMITDDSYRVFRPGVRIIWGLNP